MKTMTGIILVAVGAILAFAVNAHLGFISLQIAGLVLLLTGIAGLCLNQRGTGLLDRQLAMLRHLLGQDASEISGRRVPLNDLLSDDQLSGDQLSHDQLSDDQLSDDQLSDDQRDSARAAARPSPSSQLSPPGEVSIDDTPTSPDIWGAGRIPEGIGAGRMAP
jgi:hypothetical protein